MNKKYEYILFDLDGTLTDSKEGITKCAQYALEYYGIHEPDLKTLERFIGPPLHQSFQIYYGFSPEQAREAVEKFRERFRPIGIFENKVYEGIVEMLEALRADGFKLAVATSKPEEFALKVLERYELLQYFDVVTGANMDGTREKKDEVIAETLKRLGVGEHEKAKVIMVGDREHDLIGATACGVDAIGVRYGYAKPGELEAAKPVYIAETAMDVAAWLHVVK